MQSQRFIPTARATNWLLIVGFLAIGEALYLRYLAIEHAPVSLACQAGLKTLAVHDIPAGRSRSTTTRCSAGSRSSRPVLNLVRPSIVLLSIAIAAAGFGLVLHNADLAGLAAALLILSLARPAPAAE